MKRFEYTLTAFALAAVFVGAFVRAPATAAEPSKVYWSDGNSGRLDGMKFRLANIDAPETGSLKQRGGAKCEAERPHPRL